MIEITRQWYYNKSSRHRDPFIQDVVVTGIDHDDVGLLIFPRLDCCRALSKLESGASVGDVLASSGVSPDAVDVVVARPGANSIADGDARRLTARARTKDAVLILFGQQAASWPAVETRLSARHGRWSGIGDGYGRIKGRQLLVSVTGKGRSARTRDTELWL